MKRSPEDTKIGELIKLAHDYPQLRDHLMPVITDHVTPPSVRLASVVKKAYSEETEQFVAWCVMKNDNWDKNECMRIMDKLHVPMHEEGTAQVARGPLAKGEMVMCKAPKNTNPKNTEECEKWDGKVGNVVDIDGDALVIEFTDGLSTIGRGRFEGKESGSKTGLYRHTPSDAGGSNERAMIEVIYVSNKAAKPPSPERTEQIQDYVDKGTAAGESRSRIYYSGNPLKQAVGKNGYYFTVFAAQRDQFPTSINPQKGDVLYIGRLGARPGGWKNEFAKMLAESEGAE